MGEKRQRAEKRAAKRRQRMLRPLYALFACGTAAACAYGYRQLYPLQQRCPPQEDRFYDHCMEGRKHYQIEIDWTCLGRKRTQIMRMALGLTEEADASSGLGKVPAWLTEENAQTVSTSPCINRLRLDTACRYCVPTPRPTNSTGLSKTEVVDGEQPAPASEEAEANEHAP
eukprot:scaffold175855_cov44-Tisochrysis_lutea.AAC.1